MPPSKTEILKAIEGSMSTHIDIPDIKWLDIAGVVGRYSMTLSHPVINLVGQTNLSENNADAIIQQILSPFKQRNQILGWLVGPSAKPTDIARRLENSGFKIVADMSGLYLSDLTNPIETSSAMTVRKATAADDEHVVRLYTEAFPMPEVIARMLVSIRIALKAANYLAYVEDVDMPVAVASMYYIPNSTIVALQGAATLAPYRGRGIYSSLMAARLKDAHSDGMEIATMQAFKSTSAPICKNMGFAEMCDVTMYAWMPSS